jgi:hypothetical protein
MSEHGGKRKGSGRKKGQPTKLVRVPVRFESQIKQYIEQLKADEAQSTHLGESIKDILIPGQRNKISQLRNIFPEVNRQTLDAELTRMALNSEIHLYGHDDPSETSEQDREATLIFCGEPQYIIYLG